jgi:hypothetical protein
MAKFPINNGKPWSPDDLSQLKKLVKEDTPTRLIAMKLGRSPQAVQAKALANKLSLKPTNQSPYNRQKKK